MDRIDRAIRKVMTQPAGRQRVMRYGVSRFRRQVRQHIAAGELTFVQIDRQEPGFIQPVMVGVVSAWDFDGHRPVRRWPLTYREEITLFGHPGRMPSRRGHGRGAPMTGQLQLFCRVKNQS